MKWPSIAHLLLTAILMLGGCDQNSTDDTHQNSTITLQVWAHAGQQAERDVLQSQVARFNQQADDIDVKLTFIPERDYNSQVQAAALAHDLPDILEFDGPYLYNYIWQGHLLPLEELLPSSVINDLLPSIVAQGSYGQHLYSVAVFDSGLGLYARKSALEAIDARLPTRAADAWNVAEFNDVLSKLAQLDEDQAVLDLKLNYTGEWFSYGFSPILQSAGADLIDREDYQNSQGLLNHSNAVEALQHVQNWIRTGYVDPNLDDAAFINGRVALSWVGHWAYAGYKQAWPDDLIILPLPDFGQGSKTGQGSWNWGISNRSRHPRTAAEFISFLLKTDEVLLMSNANGAVPGTRSAVQGSRYYGADGELRLFADQLLQGVSVPRPITPAYPVITTEFQKAFQHIRNGANVAQTLNNAARVIDQDIKDNLGYQQAH
ncbi:MAG: extracellular solute-binding protein [Gammaproteobacteria bacterium]